MLPQTKEIVDLLEKQKVIFICRSNFDNFYSLWKSVLEELNRRSVKIRTRTESGYISNCSNSDGDGAWDEYYKDTKFFATKW